MKRPLVLVILVLTLSGCKGQGQTPTNPFLGQTTVAPPSTGSITGAPYNPYVQGQQIPGNPYAQPPGVAPPFTPSPQPAGSPNLPAQSSLGPYAQAQPTSGAPYAHAPSASGSYAPSQPAPGVASPYLPDRSRMPSQPQTRPTYAPTQPAPSSPYHQTLPSVTRPQASNAVGGNFGYDRSPYGGLRGPSRVASLVPPPSFVARSPMHTRGRQADIRPLSPTPTPMERSRAEPMRGAVANASRPVVSLARRERVVQPLRTRSSADIAPSMVTPVQTSASPSFMRAAGPIHLKDLPPADASSRHPVASGGTGGFRLVSDSTRSEDSVRVVAAVAIAGADSRYGYDPDYARLRGRLEYSNIDRQWKLRYIPIDGETDAFGGSVLVTNPDALGDYERGQFVEIHGRLAEKSSPGSFAPTYEVASIGTNR